MEIYTINKYEILYSDFYFVGILSELFAHISTIDWNKSTIYKL